MQNRSLLKDVWHKSLIFHISIDWLCCTTKKPLVMRPLNFFLCLIFILIRSLCMPSKYSQNLFISQVKKRQKKKNRKMLSSLWILILSNSQSVRHKRTKHTSHNCCLHLYQSKQKSVENKRFLPAELKSLSSVYNTHIESSSSRARCKSSFNFNNNSCFQCVLAHKRTRTHSSHSHSKSIPKWTVVKAFK